MNRLVPPAAALHLHIGRLVVDASAVPAGGVPRDLAALLQASLAPKLSGVPFAARAHEDRPSPWLDSLADAVATQVGGAIPESPG